MEIYTLFILGLILICVGGNYLVDAAVAIARKLGIPQLVVGATVVSLGTTLPEILVSSTAAFSGSAEISVGNALGSIICNTALIAGISQLIRPSKSVEPKSLVWRAIFFFAALAAVEIYGFVFGEYNTPLGIALIIAFIVYAYMSIKMPNDEDESGGDDSGGSIVKQILILVGCAVLLYFGADLLVDNGVLIAEKVGVPERVIAVTFIALGTSLPELITSIISLCKGYENVGLGNIIGANLLNLLLVIGIPSALTVVPVEQSTLTIDAPLAALVMMILLVPMLIRKKSSRVQGAALLAIYAIYCVASF